MNQEQRAQLGAQIKAAREKRGWSQARLAREAGVSENTVLGMEHAKGTRNNADQLRAVLDLLGIVEPAAVIELDGVPEDVRLFLNVATQRLRVMDEGQRARVLADIYPRLILDS